MIRAAIVLTALALVAALVTPPSQVGVCAIVAVAIIGAALAVAAPRPMPEPRPALRSRRRTTGGARPARYAQRDGVAFRVPPIVPAQRTSGPHDADDEQVAHLVPASARHRVDRP